MFFESMESRMLLSASPVSTQVSLDRFAIKEDLLKFKADSISCTATLLADLKAMRADGLSSDSSLMNQFVTFHTDVKNMWAQLAAQRLAETSKVLGDEANILADKAKLIADKAAGDTAAVKADRARLLDDRVQLQTDEIAGLNNRLAVREADYNTIFNDLSVIESAVSNGTNASSALQGDVQQFLTDRRDGLNTMGTDIQAVITARVQLKADLIAMET